jgi:hypothetical protein
VQALLVVEELDVFEQLRLGEAVALEILGVV